MKEVILMRNRIQNILYQIKSDKPKITPETMNGAWNFLFYPFIILGLYEYYIFLNDDPNAALFFKILLFFVYIIGSAIIHSLFILLLLYINLFIDRALSFILKVLLNE